jgi:putative transposase
MAKSKRRGRFELFSDAPPIDTWPTVLASALSEGQREVYELRSKAISMYAEGYPVAEIYNVTGIQRSMLPFLARRCISPSPDGRIMGFRALIPYYNPKEYKRTATTSTKLPEAKGGMSGTFNQLLQQFPELEKKLIQLILKRNDPSRLIHAKKIRARDLHHFFINYLRSKNIDSSQWPFNTKYLGYRTIERYIKRILDQSFDRAVTTREERAAIAHLSVGTGYEKFLAFEEPYDVVQLDAYCIDAFFTSEFLTPEGTTQTQQLARLWFLALIESCSGAILSHSTVYRSEVGADDVLLVLKKAVNAPSRTEITIPGLQYPLVGGLPSEAIPQCQGAIWGMLLLDGALSHLATAVHVRARSVLGCSVNWGPVAHFERRPDIERFFLTISENVFKRLPSTTGSNPGKGRAQLAEQNAVTYKIDAEENEQLIAIEIANYNATPSEGMSYLSPIDVLRNYTVRKADHFLLRHLPSRPGQSTVVIPLVIKRKVRGSRITGRHGYIEIDKARYTNPVLAKTGGVIGMELSIEMDEEDWRFGKAYLPDGSEIGILKAGGRWGDTKHSRKTRKAILALIARRILVLSEQQDPIQAYLNYLATSKQKRKVKGKGKPLLAPKQATEAHRVSKESGLQKKILTETQFAISKEPSLQELKNSRPTLMGGPVPDLNQLIKSKR